MNSSAKTPASNIPAIIPALEKKQTYGNFTGETLVIDEETGFLTNPPGHQRTRQITPGVSGNVFGPLSVFPARIKLQFLNCLRECWPNYSLACKTVGIDRKTFQNHYEVDGVFKECVDELMHSAVDSVEAKRFEMAMRSNGTLDRMAVLNAYRKEI